jgi:ATP-binding cassette, subfamily B (MDR/TAP), member 1
MGEGEVLEQGTHNELLSSNGAYAQLVAAQRLREAKEAQATEGNVDDIEKLAREEVPLGRSNTSRSLASELIEEKQKMKAETEHGDYNMFYLAKRMGLLIPEQYWRYVVGAMFACLTGMAFPAFGVVYASGIEGFSRFRDADKRHDGDRNALW